MIGATLGNYRIVSEIGSGGMGVVYLAEHTLLGRKAAVKLLRAELPDEYVERFFNEAKAAATLHHPGLVDVFDFGHHTDGSAYIVMEFLHGESLQERLDREPRLPVPVALSITRSVANALHVAHAGGIIHRDLKPGNIFLVTDSESVFGFRTKVLDFGIAKLQRERDARSVKTQSGAVIGTPRYMSPEQCKNARDVDGRSDIYALGCILYEMLLGVAPFEYDSWAELVGAHIYEVPAKPSEIDAKIAEDVETLVTKMLEKAANDRFATMHDLAQSAEVLLHTHGGERVRLTPPSLQRPSSASVKQKSGSGQDPTLPTPSGSGGKALTTTAAFADTDMKAGSLATLGGDSVVGGDSMLGGDTTIDPKPGPTTAEHTAPVGSMVGSTSGSHVHDASVQTEPRPKTGTTPWAAILIGGAGLVALGVAGALFMAKNSKPESETAFIVVDQRGSDSSTVARPAEAPIVDAGLTVVSAPPDADATTVSPVKPTPPTETDVAALTRTFGKQGPAITGCFKQHGESKEQISVRIQIDRRGAVRATEVMPPSVGTTALGACIADVAKRTQFGPQPKAATFRVPLYTNAR